MRDLLEGGGVRSRTALAYADMRKSAQVSLGMKNKKCPAVAV